MNIEKYKILESATLGEALQKIEENKSGAVVVVTSADRVVGIITDGDARRLLLAGGETANPIAKSFNPNFTSVDEGTPREKVLKLLDQLFNFLPVLDAEKKLKKVYTRKDFPIDQEKGTVVRARAPVRISFGGGGTDLTYFFAGSSGAVINATIKMYAHSELQKLDSQKMTIHSYDFKKSITVDTVEELLPIKEFELIGSLIQLIRPSFGFELSIHCDFPVGSGLGGSSAVLASILGCFNQFRSDPWDAHEIAELAFQAERLYSGVKGGWQDQYATVFGGFNFIEFSSEENIVHPLRIGSSILWELEENFLLCSAGGDHNSGDIHADQKIKVVANKEASDLAVRNRELTYRIRTYLLRGHLKEFGRLLHEGWTYKRQLSDKISSTALDEIYDFAIANGASGGKLLGAGGGGYFLFYAEGKNKVRLAQKLSEKGLETRNLSFELDGLQAWKIRKRD